jgi:hypothetical protein
MCLEYISLHIFLTLLFNLPSILPPPKGPNSHSQTMFPSTFHTFDRGKFYGNVRPFLFAGSDSVHQPPKLPPQRLPRPQLPSSSCLAAVRYRPCRSATQQVGCCGCWDRSGCCSRCKGGRTLQCIGLRRPSVCGRYFVLGSRPAFDATTTATASVAAAAYRAARTAAAAAAISTQRTAAAATPAVAGPAVATLDTAILATAAAVTTATATSSRAIRPARGAMQGLLAPPPNSSCFASISSGWYWRGVFEGLHPGKNGLLRTRLRLLRLRLLLPGVTAANARPAGSVTKE